MNQIVDFIVNNKTEVMTIAYAVYEILVRVKPTNKTWSLLTLVGRLIADRDKEGNVH